MPLRVTVPPDRTGQVRELIEKLEGMELEDSKRVAHFTVLMEYVKHHVQEEEKEMFPRARKLLSAAELNELGARMAQRKQQLLAAAGKPKSATTRILESVVEAISPDEPVEPPIRPTPRKSADGAAKPASAP